MPSGPRVTRPALTEASEALFRRALAVTPGGVSSPVRAFGAVGGTPRFMASGSGARVTDADGTEYVDLLASWGPLILGHAHPAVVEAVAVAASRGTSFGAPTEGEVELAELICSALPAVELVRFVSSGTEATMSALRLARAATGRDKVLKFAGCYHGHVDALLVSAGSGVLTLGLPDSPGVTEGTRVDTVVARYNDPYALDDAFARYGGELAAVIVEPVAANMGVVPPVPGFLEAIRQHCERDGALLIFDEVVTGFRIGWSGAQGAFGIRPDLTTLGKVVGGGLPIGAYGGRADLMCQVAPAGPVYQAGTLSGNPISVAAGLATLRQLQQPGTYETLDALGAELAAGLESAAKSAGVAVTVQRVGSMLTPFFTEAEVAFLDQARRCDTAAYARFFHRMLDRRVYLPPSQLEASFVSLAHTTTDIALIAAAAEAAFRDTERSPT
ncbi:MAG TPA: glutamate-1-semialdehyde 2,1-aminomutase [Acidimicrobiales bacterium]|nr:glutamate-1-semialdehyde 2,1-aminomutase [Acidimicrobiales bacterium]